MKTTLAIVLGIAWGLSQAASTAPAAVINDWTFDDPAGTDLQSVTNAGPENASFAGQTTGWETDGNGLFVASTATNYFRNADIADITGGQSWLRLEVDGWNFTGAAESEQIGFCFRTAANNNIALIKLIRIVDDQVRLQIDDGTTTTLQNYDAAGFTNGLDVIVGVDVTNDRYEMYYRTGSEDYTLGQTGVVSAAYTLDLIRFQHQNDSSQSGEFWAIDRLTHAASFADLAGPTIVSSTVASVTGLLELTVETDAGVAYRLESTTDILSDEWTDEGRQLDGTGGPRLIYAPPDADANLYRIVAPLP